MPDDVVLPSEAAWGRISDVVDVVERVLPGMGRGRAGTPTGNAVVVAPVRVSGVKDAGTGWYPGFIRRHNSDDTYSDITACWVRGANNEGLAVQDYAKGRLAKIHTDGLALYVVDGAADQCCCCGASTSGVSGTSGAGTGATVGGTVGGMTGTSPPIGGITTSMTGTGMIGPGGVIQGIPSVGGTSGGAGQCKPGQMYLAEYGLCINGCPPGTGWDGTTCQPTPYYGGPGGTGGSGLDPRGMPGIGASHPLGGFLGNRSPTLKGGSAMLSALGIDDGGTNGYVQVWNSTSKKYVPTDPATFSSGGMTQVGTGKKTAQTTTQTIATYTVGASDEILMATGNLAITGTSIGSMTFATTFTDIHSGAQSLNGTTAYNTGVTSYNALAFGEFLAKAGSTVNTIATISSGACTYDSTATIFKLR